MKTFSILIAALSFATALHAHDNYNIRSPSTNETQPDLWSHQYREIQTDTLSRLVRSANPSIVIVDTRGTKSDNGKRIPGAKALAADATIEIITANLPDKEAMIIMYCTNAQCPSSSVFSDRLVRMGYKNVWHYAGGIEEWEAKGQKVEQGKPAAKSAAEGGPKSA